MLDQNRKKNILFRVDASNSIGTGHMMRCLVLAERFRERGFHVGFICRAHRGNRNQLVTEKGFQLHELPEEKACAENPSDSFNSWLGTTWKNDARQTIEICKKHDQKIGLVVDHYAIDFQWERLLKPYTDRIMVIDDLANRHHDCALLLDHNLHDDMETRYSDLIPDDCKTLLGPTYALLHPEYQRLHQTVLPRTRVNRVLVFFGGSDPHDLTSLAIEAILSANRSDICVDVVLSKSSPNFHKVEHFINCHNQLKLYSDQPCLAELMVKADLSIGACGTTSWERCCLGVPALVVTVADNQEAVAESLHKRGLIHWLGRWEEIDAQIVVTEIKKLSEEHDLESWSKRCLNLVDGYGAVRVIRSWLNCLPQQLIARKAKEQDESILLEWANDLSVRQQSFSSRRISEREHHEWYQERLINPEQRKIFIIETVDNEAIGQVRFDAENEIWKVSYSIAASYRGLGLAKSMLKLAIERHISEVGACMIYGEVKPDNQPSRHLLKSFGFSEQYIEQHSCIRYEKYFTDNPQLASVIS